MGTFKHPIVVHAPDGSRSIQVEPLVDTGATYTRIPADLLRQLGFTPSFRQKLQMADGSVIERDAGEARVQIDGATRTTIVIFGDANSVPLLGAVTLEQFSLAPDPVGRRLVPVVALLMSNYPR